MGDIYLDRKGNEIVISEDPSRFKLSFDPLEDREFVFYSRLRHDKLYVNYHNNKMRLTNNFDQSTIFRIMLNDDNTIDIFCDDKIVYLDDIKMVNICLQ